MNWILWTAVAILVIGGALAAFITIARRGRELRRSRPLPPPAERAYLLWEEEGRQMELEVQTPFYLGKDPACNVVLPGAHAPYEACIFHHQSRFAIQTLPGADILQVDGEERQAGYLRSGDTLRIAGREFQFRCY